MSDIGNPQLYQVATSQFAIDGQIKQSKVSQLTGHFQPDSNLPDLFELQWFLLAYELVLVSRFSPDWFWCIFIADVFEHSVHVCFRLEMVGKLIAGYSAKLFRGRTRIRAELVGGL